MYKASNTHKKNQTENFVGLPQKIDAITVRNQLYNNQLYKVKHSKRQSKSPQL
jgi:hypothetical protein